MTLMAQPFHTKRWVVTQVMSLRSTIHLTLLAFRWSDQDAPLESHMDKVFGNKLPPIFLVSATKPFAHFFRIFFTPKINPLALLCTTFLALIVPLPSELACRALFTMLFLVCAGFGVRFLSVGPMPTALSLKNALPIFQVFLFIVGFLNFWVFVGHGGNVS